MIPQPPAHATALPIRPTDRLTVFQTWLRRADRGATLIYYRGFLALDRVQPAFSRGLTETADAAYDGYCKGHVRLTQRRIKASSGASSGAFEYIATRTAAPV